jgi:hypothetical protein
VDIDLKTIDLDKFVAIMNYASGAAELIANLNAKLAIALAAPKASKKEIDEANDALAMAKADALTAKNSLAPLQAMLESDNAKIAQINTLINGFVIPGEVGVVPEMLLVAAEVPTEVPTEFMDGSSTDVNRDVYSDVYPDVNRDVYPDVDPALVDPNAPPKAPPIEPAGTDNPPEVPPSPAGTNVLGSPATGVPTAAGTPTGVVSA